MKKLNLILPAAGLGSRFRDVGEDRPKPLIPVFEIPMILWVLLNFPLSENDCVYIVSQKKDCLPAGLMRYLSNFPFDVKFLEIEGLTEGPASTVSLVFDQLEEDSALIVANTDQYVFSNLDSFVDMVRNGKSDGQILTMTASSSAWSYVGRSELGLINEVVEKVEISNEATVGVYGWSQVSLARAAFQDTFANNIRTNNEFYVAPTYNFLIKSGLRVETFLVGNHGESVHGLGTPTDLNSFLQKASAKKVAETYRQMIID